MRKDPSAFLSDSTTNSFCKNVRQSECAVCTDLTIAQRSEAELWMNYFSEAVWVAAEDAVQLWEHFLLSLMDQAQWKLPVSPEPPDNTE